MKNHINSEPIIPIEPGLELREIAIDEASLLFDIVNKNREYIGRWISTYEKINKPEDCTAWLREAAEDKAAGKQYGYGIFQNIRLIGRVSLHITPEEPDKPQEPEMCYWVDETERGKGIATKAVCAFTAYGLQDLKLPHISLRINSENEASNAVARKAGYLVKGFQVDPQHTEYLWKMFSWEQDAIGTVRQPAACAQGYGMVYNGSKW